jgi:hypothetical protein
MNAVDGCTFGKFRTVKGRAEFYRLLALSEENRIVEFFDEDAEHVGIYISDGTCRYFARTVYKLDTKHLESVLGAWASRGKFVDHRSIRA